MSNLRISTMGSRYSSPLPIVVVLLLIAQSIALKKVPCESLGLLPVGNCFCHLYPRDRIYVNCREGSLKHYPRLEDRYNPVAITAIDLSYNLLNRYNDFNPDVELLNLAGNHIETIDKNAVKSKYLALLDISFNHLTSLEKTLAKTQRLVTLIATGNSIRSVEDLGFPDTLQHLYLDQNPMESFLDQVPSLKHLKVSLSAPGIQAKATISQIATGGLRNLEVLEVTDSPLALDPFSRNALSELHHLKELRLTRCDLSVFAPESEDFFEGIADSLEALWLDGNRFKTIPYNAVGVLDHLHTLNLAGNDIAHIHHADFSTFAHLTALDLSFNRISAVDRLTFTALEGLEVLNLAGNALTEIPEGTFSHLHHLKRLDLTSNKLRHLRPSSFEPYALQDIRISVGIGRNPWTCDCDIKWVLDNAAWDEKAGDDALLGMDADEDGPFYEALDEMENYRTRHSRKAHKALFPLTWFTQCTAPQKYKRMVMADLLKNKEFDYVCGNTKL